MTDMQCVVDAKGILGESPVWDSRERVLWWIDIKLRLIHRFDPRTGEDRSFPAPEDLGCIAVREKGGLVVTMRDGFHFFDPASGAFTPIGDPEADLAENRFNDGKADRQGRFWSGSMHEPQTEAIASLYRLDPDLSIHRMVDGVITSNGLAWSPDSRTMYFTDSFAYRVWAWDFDAATGEIANRRLFVDLKDTRGIGDGATVDENGCYWITLAFIGQIRCFDPQGKLVRTIQLPVDMPTSVAFGGDGMDVLYCTTATFLMPEEKRARQPQAGGLFAIDAGVRGPADAFFKG